MASGYTMNINDAPPSYEASQEQSFSAMKPSSSDVTPSAPSLPDGQSQNPTTLQLSVVVNCPRCNKQMVFPSDVMPRAGTVTTCSGCGQQFQLGAPANAATPQSIQPPFNGWANSEFKQPGVPTPAMPPMQAVPLLQPMQAMSPMQNGQPMQPMPAYPAGMGMLPAAEMDPTLSQVEHLINDAKITKFRKDTYPNQFVRSRAMLFDLQGVVQYIQETVIMPYVRLNVKLPDAVRNAPVEINFNRFLNDYLHVQRDISHRHTWNHLVQLLNQQHPDPIYSIRCIVSVEQQEMQTFFDEIGQDLLLKYPETVLKGLFGRTTTRPQHSFKVDIQESQKIENERKSKCDTCLAPYPDVIFEQFGNPLFLICFPIWIPLIFVLPFLMFFVMFGWALCYKPCEGCCCPPPNPETDGYFIPLSIRYQDGAVNYLRMLYRTNGGGLPGLVAVETASRQAVTSGRIRFS